MERLFKSLAIFLGVLFMLTAIPLKATGSDLGKLFRQIGLSEEISFSALMVEDLERSGIKPTQIKLYYKNGHIRTEGKQGEVEFVSIMRKDGKIYSYQVNTWVETDMSAILSEKDLPQFQKIGEEMVQGKTCEKFEAYDPKTQTRAWVWTQGGVILKNTTINPAGKTTILYKNIQFLELAEDLFLPPKGVSITNLNPLFTGKE